MSQIFQFNLAFIVGIVITVYLVLGPPKFHVLIALVISAATMGLIAGLTPQETVNAIGSGVGGTATWILLPVSFGVMLGKLLEVTGGAQKMAAVFLELVGEKRSGLALALTGWLVAFPVFTDTGYIILNPLAKALSSRSKVNMAYLGLALAVGLFPTNALAPPTPQPVAVAGTLGVDLGAMVIAGGIVGLILVLLSFIYINWVTKRISFLPEERGLVVEEHVLDEETLMKERKGALPAFLSIIIPVVLLLANTLSSAVLEEGTMRSFFTFIGQPYIAILIGLLYAMYALTGNMDKEERLKWMEEGLSSAGIVVCITAGGGALGSVVRTAGISNMWAETLVTYGIPAWMLGFVIAMLVKVAQGSAMTPVLLLLLLWRQCCWHWV
jgi:GntP family gluconate:H+ symporter